VSPANLLTSWDTALLMAPFAVMLAAWMFGLDEVWATPRARRRRTFSLTDRGGGVALTDPDGRPWKPTVRRRAKQAERRSGGKVASGRTAPELKI